MTDLLRSTLLAVRDLANTYMENLNPRDDAWVVLTSMFDLDGTPNPAARDRIVMTICNLTRETAISSYQATVAAPGRALGAPPLYLNVHLAFVANFSAGNYADGLAALSRLIGFFQQMPVFDARNVPGLPPQIDKVSLEFENLGWDDVHHVTDMLGMRYQPSVFFKLRMLPFASSEMENRAYPGAGPGRPYAS